MLMLVVLLALQAPLPVTTLTALPLTDSAVVLQWTEVRSTSSAIPRYVVRYDSLGKFQWNTKKDVLTGGCAAPIVGSNTAGGRLHACVLRGLQPNIAYEFQIVAYTGTLNTTAVFGSLSNVASAKTMMRVGPALVWRPGMWLDSVAVASASLVDFGMIRFPLAGKFLMGDRLATFYDSTGELVARGWLVVAKP